jgi:hypothetical protein
MGKNHGDQRGARIIDICIAYIIMLICVVNDRFKAIVTGGLPVEPK